MKRSLTITVIAVAAALFASSCSRDADGASAATGNWSASGAAGDSAPPAVDAMEVSTGNAVQAIEASGTIRGIDEVNIVSEVEGIIRTSSFALGDQVFEGTILLEVDATLPALQMEDARTLYESAEIDRLAAERRFENGSASQAELLRARSTADGARTRLQVAEKTYRDHFIRSPISGQVATKGAGTGRGNYITRGTVVARIVNLDTVELIIALGEAEIGSIRKGAEVQVSVPACGGLGVTGTVHAIAAGSDLRTGSFPVVVRWENECPDLRSGMSARAVISLEDTNRQIVVPVSALRRDDDAFYIYVVKEGVVTRRPVVIGKTIGNRAEVLEGLQIGEVIAVTALSTIAEGSRVKARVRGKTGDLL